MDTPIGKVGNCQNISICLYSFIDLHIVFMLPYLHPSLLLRTFHLDHLDFGMDVFDAIIKVVLYDLE